MLRYLTEIRRGDQAETELMLVGRVLRPHGMRGAVVVEVESDEPSRFEPGSTLLVDRGALNPEPAVINSASWHRGRLLLELEGCSSLPQAESLRGCELVIPTRDAGPLGEGEYWAHDFLGLTVKNGAGDVLGEVVDMASSTAQDAMVVRDQEGLEFLVPLIGQFVLEVDVEGGWIEVSLPRGLVP